LESSVLTIVYPINNLDLQLPGLNIAMLVEEQIRRNLSTALDWLDHEYQMVITVAFAARDVDF
jgi:hypothetical protein